MRQLIMSKIDEKTNINIGLAITLMLLVGGGIYQFFYAMNTLASESFVTNTVKDKMEVIEVQLKDIKEDMKYIRERIDRRQ